MAKIPAYTLTTWYKKPLGKELLKHELSCLSGTLLKIFGYYIMQIGGPITNKHGILTNSTIHNHIIVNPETAVNNEMSVQCDLEELPFLPESIDAAVVFHALESERNPAAILKEIYATLIPNGTVIIFGFNPFSLWGLKRFFAKEEHAPWNSKWISLWRMRRMLTKNGFKITDFKTIYFRPPSNNNKQLFFLEGLGQFFWPGMGASYMLVAKKSVIGLTPIMQKPLKKNLQITNIVSEPTTMGRID